VDIYSGIANKMKPSVPSDNTKYVNGVGMHNKPVVLTGDALEPVDYSQK